MGVWIVDPDWYFSTAGQVGGAAEGVANAMGTAEDNLSFQANNMAGNDPVGTSWGTRYDSVSLEMLEGVKLLCTAWSGLGIRLYQAGENHAWAEFEAGRRQFPAPQNMPPPPPIREPQVGKPPSSVGDNGPGLDDIIPGLLNLIGRAVPNGDTLRLSEASEALAELSVAVTTSYQSLIAGVRTPDESLPDATAFYQSVLSVSGPAQAVAADALTLSAQCQIFSTALTTMRENIQREIDWCLAEIEGTVVVGGIVIIATRLQGAKAIIKEVTQHVIERIEDCAERINLFIDALETAIAPMQNYTASLTAALKAILNKYVSVAVGGNARLPDGTLVPVTRYFTPAKAAAWERYLERDGEWDIDKWSKQYDVLATNAATGWQFDNYAARSLGYDVEEGWQRQYSNNDIVPGRRWDYAHIDQFGNPLALVENKSGGIDYSQLAEDRQAIRQGYTVIWNLNSNYPYTEQDWKYLNDLVESSNGRFIVNEI